MNNSIYRVCLDIHNTHAPTQLVVSKGDNAREIEFTLTDGGAVYRIAEDCTAIFRAQKPDGTVLYNECVIVGDRIEYQLTSQTSASVGILQCELEILGNGKVLTAPRFTIRVADTVYSDDEIESEDEFTELTTAITEAGNVNISATKSGNTATITVTDRDGVETSVEIYDGGTGTDVTATDEDGYLKTLTIGDTTHNAPPVVSGTSVGNAWTALSIGGVEKGLPGNVKTSQFVNCESGWNGNGMLTKGGHTCGISFYPSYVSGGTIMKIPTGFINIFGVYGVCPIIRGATGIAGFAAVHIKSDGDMIIDYVYGTTLQSGDVLDITLTWVV